MSRIGFVILLSWLCCDLAPRCRGDIFRYRDAQGNLVEVEARLAGSGQGAHALELSDGQFRIIPQAAVEERLPRSGPEPLAIQQMVERLQQQFPRDRFRVYKRAPYVVGLILASPVEQSDEIRIRGFMKKTARFMKLVEGVFMKFAKSARFPLTAPKFPLVTLVFESDRDFERYAQVATGGRGISAKNIAGFYSAMTNFLVLRLRECHTFETPLHEAIHQQVHNRNVLQRLAPIPVWFNEGLATGFEGNAQRINIGPNMISPRYAKPALRARQLDWKTVIADDRAFRGNVLAGEAYAHAWSIHWLLVTRHKVRYMSYVKSLSKLTPLSKVDSATRIRDFEETFESSVPELQQEFKRSVEIAMRKQRTQLDAPATDGVLVQQSDMAEVRVQAVSTDRILRVTGKLKNISPIRTLSFVVRVETNAGSHADWHVSDLGVNKTTVLPRQAVAARDRGAATSFKVRVYSAAPRSETGRAWSRGRRPNLNPQR